MELIILLVFPFFKQKFTIELLKVFVLYIWVQQEFYA